MMGSPDPPSEMTGTCRRFRLPPLVACMIPEALCRGATSRSRPGRSEKGPPLKMTKNGTSPVCTH